MPLIYRQFIIYTILALLSGCAKIPTVSPEQRAQLEQPARQYMARSAWREAALAWQQAANQVTGTLAAQYQLNAASALLKAGDGDGARKLVQGLQGTLPLRVAERQRLILAEADLLSGNAPSALQRLGPALKSRDRVLLQDYHRLRAEALRITGQTLAAIRERSLLESFLPPGPDLYSNRQQIWNALSQVNDAGLQSVELQPPFAFSGWVALARLVRTSAQDVVTLQAAIDEWNQQYPGHPAGEQIIPQLFEQALADSQPPTKVAFLLPLSGPFKAAAEAIRDGTLAAWFADAPNPRRPELIFRDSSNGDISNTYREALAGGAQFIVGPLAKERVAELLQTGDIQAPTLALNYPEYSSTGSPPPQNENTNRTKPMYQFALAPEDEASRAAERAFAAGHRRAAVLAPQGPWGERVTGAFSSAWTRLGGEIAGQEFYS